MSAHHRHQQLLAISIAASALACVGIAITFSACSSSTSTSTGPQPVERNPTYCKGGVGGCDCGPNPTQVGGTLTQPCSAQVVSPNDPDAAVCCAQSGFVTAGNGDCRCVVPAFACGYIYNGPGLLGPCICGVNTPLDPESVCTTQGQGSFFDAGLPPPVCCLSAGAVSCSCSSENESDCADAGGSAVATCTVDMVVHTSTCAALLPDHSFTVTDCRAF